MLMAAGSTTEFSQCVHPIAVWQAGATIDQLCASSPFVTAEALGRAFEEGRAVEREHVVDLGAAQHDRQHEFRGRSVVFVFAQQQAPLESTCRCSPA